MKYVHSTELVIVGLFICIAIGLNIFVLISALSSVPSGREFIPVYSSIDQYAFSVSVIKQGMEGSISVFKRFPFFFLLLGWCGSLIGLTSAHLIYHAARILLLFFWCISSYRLICVLSEQKWVRIAVIGISAVIVSTVQVFTPDMLFGQIMLMTICVSMIKYLRHDTGLPAGKAGNQSIKVHQRFSTWWHYDSKSGKRWLVRSIVAASLLFLVYPWNISYSGSTGYLHREKGFREAIHELETIVHPDQSILSGRDSGMLIPTYINRTVNIGSEAFYSGEMNACDAYMFAKTNIISAVFYSETEKKLGDAVRFYSFLQPWNMFVYRFVDIKPEGCAQ